MSSTNNRCTRRETREHSICPVANESERRPEVWERFLCHENLETQSRNRMDMTDIQQSSAVDEAQARHPSRYFIIRNVANNHRPLCTQKKIVQRSLSEMDFMNCFTQFMQNSHSITFKLWMSAQTIIYDTGFTS